MAVPRDLRLRGAGAIARYGAAPGAAAHIGMAPVAHSSKPRKPSGSGSGKRPGLGSNTLICRPPWTSLPVT